MNLKKGIGEKIGYNFRMTNLQAALGLAQIEKIEKILKRKKVFEKYKELMTPYGFFNADLE